MFLRYRLAFLALCSFLFLPFTAQAWDFDLIVGGYLPSSQATGEFADSYNFSGYGPGFHLSTKFTLWDHITIAREANASLMKVKPKNQINTTNSTEPDYELMVGAGAFMLGLSFGDETRFNVEVGIPENGALTMTEKSQTTSNGSSETNTSYTTDSKSQIYGASIDFGGQGSGMYLTYRHIKITADNAWETGQDLVITSNSLGASFRYRW